MKFILCGRWLCSKPVYPKLSLHPVQRSFPIMPWAARRPQPLGGARVLALLRPVPEPAGPPSRTVPGWTHLPPRATCLHRHSQRNQQLVHPPWGGREETKLLKPLISATACVHPSSLSKSKRRKWFSPHRRHMSNRNMFQQKLKEAKKQFSLNRFITETVDNSSNSSYHDSDVQ